MRCNICALFNKVCIQASFVRHAQTQFDSMNILHGSSKPEMPLTPIGKIQAERLGKQIAHIQFAKVYSSDYKRATQTAEIVLAHSTFAPLKITTDQRLREMHLGELDGRRLPDFDERGIHHKAGFQNFVYSAPQGAESFSDMNSRVKSVFQDLCDITDSEPKKADDCQEKNILLVTHSGFLLFLMEYLQTHQNLYQLSNFNDTIAYTMPENSSLTQVKIYAAQKSSPRLIDFDFIHDTSHLDFMDE